jgi:hypothetical protein
MSTIEFCDVGLSTDADCVYVDGMPLASILAAVLPSRERRQHPGALDVVGRYDLTIRLRNDESPPKRASDLNSQSSSGR